MQQQQTVLATTSSRLSKESLNSARLSSQYCNSKLVKIPIKIFMMKKNTVNCQQKYKAKKNTNYRLDQILSILLQIISFFIFVKIFRKVECFLYYPSPVGIASPLHLHSHHLKKGHQLYPTFKMFFFITQFKAITTKVFSKNVHT